MSRRQFSSTYVRLGQVGNFLSVGAPFTSGLVEGQCFFAMGCLWTFMDLSRLKETRATSLPEKKEEGPASLRSQLDRHDHHL